MTTKTFNSKELAILSHRYDKTERTVIWNIPGSTTWTGCDWNSYSAVMHSIPVSAEIWYINHGINVYGVLTYTVWKSSPLDLPAVMERYAVITDVRLTSSMNIVSIEAGALTMSVEEDRHGVLVRATTSMSAANVFAWFNSRVVASEIFSAGDTIDVIGLVTAHGILVRPLKETV